jgi:hypothetical protein
MKAAPAFAALVASTALSAGLPDLPQPGVGPQAIDLSAYVCDGDEAELSCRRALPGTVLLQGVPASERVLLFRAGLLSRVTEVFPEARFEEVRRGLAANLGTGKEGVELLRAGMGGTFPNRLQIWRGKGRVYLLEQYFERVRNSALSVMTEDEFGRLMTLRDRQRVRGARDL